MCVGEGGGIACQTQTGLISSPSDDISTPAPPDWFRLVAALLPGVRLCRVVAIEESLESSPGLKLAGADALQIATRDSGTKEHTHTHTHKLQLHGPPFRCPSGLPP